MRNIVNRVQILLLCFTAFVFPLYIKATSLSLILLFILAFFTKENRQQILYVIRDYRYYIFILPLIIASLGLLYGTYNYGRLQILETLSSLVLFPIVFKTFSINNFKRRHQWINTWFIIGLLTAFVICTATSLSNYIQYHDLSYMYYTRLTHLIMLPNQLSIYVLWGLLILLFDLSISKKQLVFFNNKIVKISIIICLLIFLFLMASKAAFLIFTICIITLFVIMIVKRTIPIWQSLIIIACLITPSIYLFNNTNIKPRLTIAYNAITNKTPSNYGSTESTALRMAAINASFKLIEDNFWTGVGTGNVKKALILQYHKDRVPSNYKLQTNPHNQFIYSLTMNGIAGLLALFGVFICMFASALRKKQNAFFIWTLMMMLFLMSDDLFVIQVGIVFFSFYSSMFLWGRFKKEDN